MDDLIATKSLIYNTRRLSAGDVFQARPRDAKLLIAIKKAKTAGVKVQSVAPSAHVPVSDASTLRAEYARKFGKKPYMGWDAATLQAKLARA